MPSNNVAVRLSGVSKRYYLNLSKPLRLRELAGHPRELIRQVLPREPFWALRDIDLEVHRGESLGIIGPNGSGKSTLLSILVGISPPTSGTVEIHGRYAALFDLGAGFHPMATGRENAYVNALFMGLSKSEAKRLVPEMLEFAGLEAFADQPTRTYSSGMMLRLGFAVAVHVRPEILLIDEVIAVGDAEFQDKCFKHFERLKAQNTTIILVSHNLEQLAELTDRIVLLKHGEIERVGDPHDVTKYYLQSQIDSSSVLRRRFENKLRQAGMVP